MKAWSGARYAFVLALAPCVGCATTPDIEPAIAEVRWTSFERGISATLVTRGFGDSERLQQSGRLPPDTKVVDGPTMGLMVKILKDYRFFDRAVAISPDAPGLSSTVPQIISYRDAHRTLTLQFLPSPGRDSEKVAWDRDFVTIKSGLLDIHRNTFSLSVVPSPSPGGGR